MAFIPLIWRFVHALYLC